MDVLVKWSQGGICYYIYCYIINHCIYLLGVGVHTCDFNTRGAEARRIAMSSRPEWDAQEGPTWNLVRAVFFNHGYISWPLKKLIFFPKDFGEDASDGVLLQINSLTTACCGAQAGSILGASQGILSCIKMAVPVRSLLLVGTTSNKVRERLLAFITFN